MCMFVFSPKTLHLELFLFVGSSSFEELKFDTVKHTDKISAALFLYKLTLIVR